MKSFIAFWKKDAINKMIVIAFLALTGGAFAFGLLIFNTPQGMSLSDFFANSLPARATPIADATSTPTVNIPVFTTSTSAPDSQLTLPAPALTQSTPTPELLPTSTTAASIQTLQPSAQSVPSASTCVPAHSSQTGKVVEVLDGNTIRVLIDKLVYVVRYIGVELPKDKKYADAAKAENSKLVYGKEVVLITDVSDKDSRGRLLRYAMQGNIFINQNLIERGLGSALDVPPDSSCADNFKQAQQSANAALLGMWSVAATPTTP